MARPVPGRSLYSPKVPGAVAVAGALRAIVVALCLVLPFVAAGCAAGGEAGGGAVGGTPETGLGPSGSGPTGATTLSPRPSGEPSPRAGPSGGPGKTTVSTGPPVRLVFVDVGQGDAVIVKAGSFECLVDGGPHDAEEHLESELRKARIARLDLLVVTHPHEDHIGALPAIVREFRPRRAVVDAAAPTLTFRALKRSLSQAGTRTVRRFRGARLRSGAVKAVVLSPGRLSGDTNGDSVVLLLNVYGRRVLLTGDLTGANEGAVGRLVAGRPRLFILKVAHHGSAGSTSSWFLRQARPRFAVIQVGANDYGHPAASTLRRLKAAGARVFTTRAKGDIWVTITPAGRVTWRFG